LCPKHEEEEAACPICNKLVSLEVSSCPHCGAEFEADEEVVEAEVEAAEDDEGAACPVCAKIVSLEVSCCPHCGAEFEEEEVEEIIEVEERRVPAKAKAATPAKAKAKAKAAPQGTGIADFFSPTSIIDFRVIGVALMILGIVGSQIALLIDWYWTWVPPIEDNMALFALLPLVVLIVGLLVFMLVKKALSSGKSIPDVMPRTSLSLFLFGIFALVVMLLWNSINSALESSQMGVAGGFFVVVVIGIVLVFMGMKTAAEKGSAA
jgi:RNA polymerase subunit RPABC4/transcription elongation factor Spt4